MTSDDDLLWLTVVYDRIAALEAELAVLQAENARLRALLGDLGGRTFTAVGQDDDPSS